MDNTETVQGKRQDRIKEGRYSRIRARIIKITNF